MIRHRRGNQFLLFTQHDHALLAGQMAQRLGGGPIQHPSPQTLEAISLHDSGWPLHDDQPTLNAQGEPLHVFETAPKIATLVWAESARRAAAVDPYTGLLVSLHVLHLSMMMQNTHRAVHDVFDLNKFQHAQIELQEKLRPQVGLSIDRPLTHGLAVPGESPEEDALRSDFQLLRFMDSLSLILLCSPEMAATKETLSSGQTGSGVTIRAQRTSEFVMAVHPWIFATQSLELSVPFRRISATPYGSEAEFRSAYANALVESMVVQISEGSGLLQ